VSTAVAHLITPYLFLTGSWIHSQLTHNREFRPIVITQSRENEDVFPFDPVVDLSPQRASTLGRIRFNAEKYIRGHYPTAPYEKALSEHDVRILHAHLGWEGARTIELRRPQARPLITSFYGRDATLLARHPYWKRLYRRLFGGVDRVLAEGHFMAETLREIGAPSDRVRVVHLGVDPDAFPFREREDDGSSPIVALLSASFREKKGIRYAIAALAKIKDAHPRLRLRIVGDGPLKQDILAQIDRLGIGDRIDLLGYQPYPVYREELEKAHFLLAPSVVAKDGDSEGGAPVCLIEAQAMGLPIVATTHCDIPEITRPDHSAFLAPERDADALASRLDHLLEHPEKWGAMGRAGREHIETEFNIRTQVLRMNEVYREVLA